MRTGKKSKFYFSLGTSSRTFFLFAETQETMMQWVERIGRGIDALNGGGGGGGGGGVGGVGAGGAGLGASSGSSSSSGSSGSSSAPPVSDHGAASPRDTNHTPAPETRDPVDPGPAAIREDIPSKEEGARARVCLFFLFAFFFSRSFVCVCVDLIPSVCRAAIKRSTVPRASSPFCKTRRAKSSSSGRFGQRAFLPARISSPAWPSNSTSRPLPTCKS